MAIEGKGSGRTQSVEPNVANTPKEVTPGRIEKMSTDVDTTVEQTKEVVDVIVAFKRLVANLLYDLASEQLLPQAARNRMTEFWHELSAEDQALLAENNKAYSIVSRMRTYAEGLTVEIPLLMAQRKS